MTYEAFLDWLDEDTRAEWVGGRVQVTSPASMRHQQLAHLLTTLLDTYVRRHDLGVVLCAPFQCKLGPDLPGREPDVLVVLRDQLDRLHPIWLDGCPGVVVEVTSPESAARDRGEKYLEYERGGALEYWLVDPERQEAVFHVRSAGGRFHARSQSADGTFDSVALPGLSLRVDWLWADPLPDAASLALEIARGEGR